MAAIIFQLLINSIIMFIVVYGFHIIGQIANNKFFNAKFKYSMHIGFAWFIASFQILSFPFILVQSKFSTFLIFFGLFALGWLVYIFSNRKYIKWKVKIKKVSYIALLFVFIFSVLALRSYVYSDSWLYSAMITSTIENNLIYSNNGTLANVQLSIMHHRFESYYLWQAVLSMLFAGKYLIALVTSYKIFDAFLFIFTFMEIGHQFKLSKIKSAFMTLGFFVLLASPTEFLNMIPFQTSEPPVQFFQLSTGTALYHYYVIPFAMLYLKLESKFSYKQKNIYLLTMLVAFSALSTTFYYTLPLFYITILYIKHLIEKRKDEQIVLSFMACWLIIIASYVGLLTMSILITGLFIVGFIILSKVVLIVYRKLSLKAINITTLILTAIYAIGGIILFNPYTYMSHDFTTDKEALRIYNTVVKFNNGTYSEVILPVIFGALLIGLLIYIMVKKDYKVYAQYILIYSAIFLNPLAITLYKVIGVQPVISRIFAFTFIGYLALIVCFQLSKNIIIKFVLMLWIIIPTMYMIIDLPGEYGTKKYQMSKINNDMDNLAKYDFAEDSFVVFDNMNASSGLEVYYTGINKLVVLNPSLSWSPGYDTCNEVAADPELGPNYQHCYTIYDRDSAEDLNYVYETDNHLIYQNY